nr:hypothetical protein [Pseudanabaena sp. 'Roaring Creek']
MSFDNTCKFLAETFPSDFASWLLGSPINLTKLEPSELLLEPIRADSVIFLESAELILHSKLSQTKTSPSAWQTTDYAYIANFQKNKSIKSSSTSPPANQP